MSMLLLIVVTISCTLTLNAASVNFNLCNPYEGEWVYDETYPLFNSSECTLIRREFACQRYGRPDHQYLKYRWQPKGCDLPRFDGLDFLRRLKGKKILFIGDSISTNQWQSLLCLLMAADNNATTSSNNSIPTYTFQRDGVSVSIFASNYLVDIEREESGRVLKLDSIKNGETWQQYDVLIFNTWLWWFRRGSGQPWDLIENDGKIMKDMDRMDAFRKGLTTWAKWVNSDVNTQTTVFFQGVSPSHYNGAEWNESRVIDCSNETTPLQGSSYPGGEPLPSKVMKDVLKTEIAAAERVHLLDITTLSQLRKDGHPGRYNGFNRMDCTHWCIAGVLETWNQLLYAQLVRGS